MHIRIRSAFALFLGLSASAPLWATPVITSIRANTFAYNSAIDPNLDSHAAVSSGLTSGTSASSIASESATLDYAASAAGAATTIDYRFHESIGAPFASDYDYYDDWYGTVSGHAGDSYAQALGGADFTLDAADAGYSYTLSGNYVQLGTSATDLFMTFNDLTSSEELLFSRQSDFPASTDAQVDLGLSGTTNFILNGNLTGLLEAGHSYSLTFYTLTRHYENGDGPFTNANNETPTTGTGGLTLTVTGPVPAVPEPTSLALFGAGLTLLTVMGLRRKA